LSLRLTISKVLLPITFTCITLQQACHFLTKAFEQACASESLQLQVVAPSIHRTVFSYELLSPHHTAMHASTEASTRRPFSWARSTGKPGDLRRLPWEEGVRAVWWALGVQMSGKGATRERVYRTVARARAAIRPSAVSPRLQPKETCVRSSAGRICVWADVVSAAVSVG
jgi:hypothetical protein